MATYTYSTLRDSIVDPLKNDNITTVTTLLNILNRAARFVVSEIDLRSTKRRAATASKLFDDEYYLTCPTDLKDTAIIDFKPQVNRRLDSRLVLVSETEFDLKKTLYTNRVAVSNDDMVRKIRYSIDADDEVLTVANFDSLTGDGGTWALFGDAENVAADTDNAVSGGGSVRFDISSAGGTTAGLQNTGLTTFDITDYIDGGSAFIWVYINSVADTGSDGLTNFIIRIGNDSSNYYTQTVTTTNEGVAFVAGWNLLRFDFASMTQTGTVDPDNCDYVAIYMTKETGKVDNGYRVDKLQLHTGEYYEILYYSKYAWQDNTGAWIENSTAATDYINADTDELRLFELRGKYELNRENSEWEQAKLNLQDYEFAKAEYIKNNPSERARRDNRYMRV